MAKTQQDPHAEALRTALEGRKMSWVAAASGVGQQRLYRLTSGRGQVTLAEAAAIASALKVPVESLLPPVEPVAAGAE